MITGSNKLNNSSIVVSTHVYATGPAQDLKDFLVSRKIKNLLFIGHPLFYSEKLRGSGFELFFKGISLAKDYKKIKKLPPIIAYIKDIFLNMVYVAKSKQSWDLYIGSDNLNTFSGLILKKLGLVKKVVYYVIDYNPKRFENKLLNHIYHKVDHFCVNHSDEVWNLSPRMQEGRKEYFNFEGGNQLVVPVGVWYDRIPRKNSKDLIPFSLVFMGHVLEKQGIQYVLDAVPSIAKDVPDFKFIIIGDGPYLTELQKQAENLDISPHVEFRGFMKSHEDLEDLISRCTLAVALYEKYDALGNLTFTYFADPMKLKVYLASGVPVITTDVSHTATLIEQKNLGVIVTLNPIVIADTVTTLMKDSDLLQTYRNNISIISREFDWIGIFEPNLERILK